MYCLGLCSSHSGRVQSDLQRLNICPLDLYRKGLQTPTLEDTSCPNEECMGCEQSVST